MSWLKKSLGLTIILAVVIAVGGNWYIKQIMQDDAVPIEEVKTRLESMYQGSVEQLTEVDSEYQAEILKNGALYRATVDRKTGKVKTMALLKEVEPTVEKLDDEKTSAGATVEQPKPPTVVQEQPVVEKPTPIPLPKEEPKPQSPAVSAPQAKPQPTPQVQPEKKSVVLSEQQAIAIALGRLKTRVPVEVDDVDFVSTQQGGYYLVELELDTDAELDEVVYQIHAISGKVMSESWDD